ncbi:MAG: helix-turn-helix domain-containing protein [archaeon]
MIVEKNFLNKLKELGLNSYEAKIWTALLSRGISSAGELSEISNVPRSRSYDVLENLEKKGFVIMKLGKPIKYIALPPKDVFDRVKKKIKEDFEKDLEAIEKIRESEILPELDLLHQKGVSVVDPIDFSGCLKNRGHLYNQMSTLIREAKSSITIMTTAKGIVRKADLFKNALERAKKRNVTIKIATEINGESQSAVDKLAEIAEIRHIDGIKSRFCIADGKQVLFALLEEADQSYDMGIWVNTEFFAKTLHSFFELAWNDAKVMIKN